MNFNFRHTDPATILDGDLIEAQRELGSVEYGKIGTVFFSQRLLTHDDMQTQNLQRIQQAPQSS